MDPADAVAQALRAARLADSELLHLRAPRITEWVGPAAEAAAEDLRDVDVWLRAARHAADAYLRAARQAASGG